MPAGRALYYGILVDRERHCFLRAGNAPDICHPTAAGRNRRGACGPAS
ncbi:MAG: hypothetical protein U0587_16275 [Candidatus Binatia bacterium]